jgi:predicted XRE-type DNA-binding protein
VYVFSVHKKDDLTRTVAINQIIQGRTVQAAAARRLKVNQPKVSALSNDQLDGCSVERLMNFVAALDWRNKRVSRKRR